MAGSLDADEVAGAALTLSALASFYQQGVRTVRLNVDAEDL